MAPSLPILNSEALPDAPESLNHEIETAIRLFVLLRGEAKLPITGLGFKHPSIPNGGVKDFIKCGEATYRATVVFQEGLKGHNRQEEVILTFIYREGRIEKFLVVTYRDECGQILGVKRNTR